MGRVSEMIKASTGSFDLSFITAGVMLIVGAALTMGLKDIRKVAVVKADPIPAVTPAKEASAG